MKILYITYDGILEPLGQSQVLAYQEKLATKFEIFLFSYEKPRDLSNTDLFSSIQKRVFQSNIKWIFHKYHKFPTLFSTFYDLFVGIIHCSYLVWRYEIKIIHARSYPPALIALVLKKLFRIKFLFDMRGFWADERVDGEIWQKDSLIFKATKALEKSFILNADHIVSLTHAAVNEIDKFPYIDCSLLNITVISTCVDLEKFSSKAHTSELDTFTLGYLGTVGTWYLFEETVKAFRVMLTLKPNTKILIINKGEHDYIQSTLENYQIPAATFKIIAANHSDVPKLIQTMDAAIFFLKPFFSKQAAAPTKLGELLASGVPSLTNEGVGDMAKILKESNAGIAIASFEEEDMQKGVSDLIALTQEDDIIPKCRRAAERNFALSDGISDYEKIYNNLLE